MRDLFILLKYGIRGSSLVLSKKGSLISSILPVVMAVLVFGLPIYYTEYMTFSKPMPIEAFYLISGLWSLIMSLLTLTSVIPGILYSITGSEDREFLSYMPINGSTLRWYFTTIAIFANPMMPVAYVMGLVGIYRGYGLNVWLGFFNGIAHVFMLVGLSSLVAFLLSWGIKATRRLYMYSFLIDVILLVLIIQINPATAGSPIEMAKKLLSMRVFLTSKYSPFFWPMVYKPCKIAALGLIFFMLSSYIPMGEQRKELSGGKKKFRGKEVTLFFRKEQNAFFLAYPLIFALLYGYFVRSDTIAYFIHISFAAFYSSVSAGSLIQEELLIYPVSKVFPVRFGDAVMKKVITNLLIYTSSTLPAIVFGTLNGFGKEDLIYILSFPVVIFLSSSFGVLEALKNPDFNRGKVLSGRGLLKVESTGVGFAILAFAVPSGALDIIYRLPESLKISILIVSIALGIYLGVKFTKESVRRFELFEF